jgi:hypothetical protein
MLLLLYSSQRTQLLLYKVTCPLQLSDKATVVERKDTMTSFLSFLWRAKASKSEIPPATNDSVSFEKEPNLSRTVLLLPISNLPMTPSGLRSRTPFSSIRQELNLRNVHGGTAVPQKACSPVFRRSYLQKDSETKLPDTSLSRLLPTRASTKNGPASHSPSTSFYGRISYSGDPTNVAESPNLLHARTAVGALVGATASKPMTSYDLTNISCNNKSNSGGSTILPKRMMMNTDSNDQENRFPSYMSPMKQEQQSLDDSSCCAYTPPKGLCALYSPPTPPPYVPLNQTALLDSTNTGTPIRLHDSPCYSAIEPSPSSLMQHQNQYQSYTSRSKSSEDRQPNWQEDVSAMSQSAILDQHAFQFETNSTQRTVQTQRHEELFAAVLERLQSDPKLVVDVERNSTDDSKWFDSTRLDREGLLTGFKTSTSDAIVQKLTAMLQDDGPNEAVLFCRELVVASSSKQSTSWTLCSSIRAALVGDESPSVADCTPMTSNVSSVARKESLYSMRSTIEVVAALLQMLTRSCLSSSECAEDMHHVYQQILDMDASELQLLMDAFEPADMVASTTLDNLNVLAALCEQMNVTE